MQALLKRPSAFLPIVMSFTALLVVVVHIAYYGPSPQPDEGTAAHLWQLLMAAQIPIIGWFVVSSLSNNVRGAVKVLMLQMAAGLAAAAPIWLLNW